MKVKVDGHEIRDADISHISLVKRGANRQKFKLLKSANGLSEVIREVLISKKDTPKQVCYAEVYVPMVPDSHSDWMTEAQIERTAHDFMKNAHVRNVDHEHNLQATGSVVVESFIAREDDMDFVPGAWVVGVHVPDKKLWAAIEKGEITGFSMYGQGVRVPSTIEIEKSADITLFQKNLQELEAMTAKLKKSVPPGSNFVAPATGGEELHDSQAQAADRARNERKRSLERTEEQLKGEIRLVECRPGLPEPQRQRAIYDLSLELNAVQSALSDLRNPVAKSLDALDLLAHGVATNFVWRGGQSHTLEVPETTSEIAKAQERAFWADLAADSFGIRR